MNEKNSNTSVETPNVLHNYVILHVIVFCCVFVKNIGGSRMFETEQKEFRIEELGLLSREVCKNL